MSFNIKVEGGSSIRLPVAGKYCDRDIVIAATTVEGGGIELPVLVSPGSAADLMLGKQLIDGEGKVVDGSFTLENEFTAQNSLIEQIKKALQGKVSGGGGDSEEDPIDLYQRVAYIEPAEEGVIPYFITDFVADNDAGLEVVASFPTLEDRIPMGSREDAGSTRFYCVYPLSASSIYYGFNTGSSISCRLTTNTVYRLQTNFLNSRLINVYTEDGTRMGGGSINATLTPHTAPVAIFGYNSAANGVVSSRRKYALYSARCSRGHAVVREYIPCYRKSDGKIGLLELFTWEFLLPEGEPLFIKGPDVDW